MEKKNDNQCFKKHLAVLAIAMTAALYTTPALAFDFDTGNPDLSIRWNNTVKLNLARRMEGQDPNITRSPNFNDGDLNFNKGAMASERIDLLSDFELNYRHQMGFHLSGAAWYDAAYNNLSNPTPNHLVNGKPATGLSSYTDRYAHGPSGELLEAYVFRNYDFGQQKLNFTAGKSLQSWGNSIYAPLYGINYGQFPIDLGKLFGVPLNERKEVYLPRNQLTVDYTLSPQWAFGAEYFLDWQHTRFPEAGSYMGMYDLALDGGESAYVGNTIVTRGNDPTPNKVGDFGIYTKWTPNWLGGTLGLFYRKTADTLPDTVILNPVTKQYVATYASGIDIYGISLTKNIAGIKFGADLSYRDNMPLASQQVITVSPANAGKPGFIGAMPQNGQTGGAIGKTANLVVNGVAAFGKTPLFDKASLVVELAWNRMLSVTKNYAQYRGNPAYTGIDKSTRDFYALNLNFTPTWSQVYPGVDLSMPLSYAVGLKGESSVPLGGNEHTGNYSVGLSALVNSKYQFDLKYSSFFGPFATNQNGQITSFAGLMSLLKDRGTLWLTFKTKF